MYQSMITLIHSLQMRVLNTIGKLLGFSIVYDAVVAIFASKFVGWLASLQV